MVANNAINDYLFQSNYSAASKASSASSVASALSSFTDGQVSAAENSFAGFGGISDSFSLSPESIKAYGANYIANQLFNVASEKSNGQYKTLGQVEQDFQSELASFTGLASDLFSVAGITSPITLQMNGVGGLFQANTGKDSGKVDAILTGASGNKLTSQFALVAARAAILEAANDAQFTSDYNTNPPATMEKYEDKLKELMLSYQLTLENGKAVSSFA